ncbi:hypothetical protein AB0M43_04240 [Longispora sp. NPDC051575]|uniref:hypothetical protein n=1 Tax=Longispora sp. NPDC051575 TaxID=3154943 RepID=UPI003417F00C
MRRTSRYALAWLVTTALAVTLSWIGIQGALDRTVGTYDAADVTLPVATQQVVRLTVPTPTLSASPSPSRTPSPTPRKTTAAPPAPSTQPVPHKTGQVYKIDSDGGSVRISYTSGDVWMVDDEPGRGYTTTVERRSAVWVIVRFTAAQNRSTVSAYWWNGPYAEVTDERH